MAVLLHAVSLAGVCRKGAPVRFRRCGRGPRKCGVWGASAPGRWAATCFLPLPSCDFSVPPCVPRARDSRVPIRFMPKGKRRWNVAQVRDQPTSDRGQTLPPRLGAVAWAPSASEAHGAVEYGE